MMKSGASFASVRARAHVNHDPQIKLFNRRSPLTLPPPSARPSSPCPKVINYAPVFGQRENSLSTRIRVPFYVS